MDKPIITEPTVMCFTCHVRPAGHGKYYQHSAYCYKCQPMPKTISGIAQYAECDALFNR